MKPSQDAHVLATGSRSELPSSEDDLIDEYLQIDPSSEFAGPTNFISSLSFSSRPVAQNEKLAISGQPFQPRRGQGLSHPKSKLFFGLSDQKSSHSLSHKSTEVVYEGRDDITSPLNSHRSTDTMKQHRPQKTELCDRDTQMNITASHIDRQINSFLQETNAHSAVLIQTPSFNSPQPTDRDSLPLSSSVRSKYPDPDETEEEDDHEFQFDAPLSSLRMAGSRPPSRAMSIRSRSRAPSTCSSFVAGEDEAEVPGYLFIHGVPPLRIRKSRAASKQCLSDVPDEKRENWDPSRKPYVYPDDSQQRYPDLENMDHHSLHSPKSKFQGVKSNSESSSHILKSPQHAWYFIRRLVGLELRWEAARAWKLTDLNVVSVNVTGRHPGEDFDDDKSTYSWDSFSDETTTAAENLPILRYLIQNFLLTLPLIRDTTTITPIVQQSSNIKPQVPQSFAPTSVYWTAGVLPILRKLHQSNLSAGLDLGSPGFLHTLFDSHIARFLERFIAASLRLCAQRLHSIPYLTQANGSAPNRTTLARNPDSHQIHDPSKPLNVNLASKSSNASSFHAVETVSKQVGKIPKLAEISVERLPDHETCHFSKNDSVIHQQEVSAMRRDQPRTYINSFEREPQRYSGVSLQPSQRASIGIITPSNSNGMPEFNGVDPSSNSERYSTDFLNDKSFKNGATALNTPSSKTVSPSSAYELQPTDTEISASMPSILGSLQVSPAMTPRAQQSNQLGVMNDVKSHSPRGTNPGLALQTSEGAQTVRQAVEKLKLERNTPSECGKEDEKSGNLSRLSRRFSWKRLNGMKTGTSPQLDETTILRVRQKSDSGSNSTPSEQAKLLHNLTLLDPSLSTTSMKQLFEGNDHDQKALTTSIGIQGADMLQRAMMKHTTNHKGSDMLIRNMEAGHCSEQMPLPVPSSGRNFINILSHTDPLSGGSANAEIDPCAEGKTANRWGFTLKSLSLPKNVNTTRARSKSTKESRSSLGFEPEKAPQKTPSSPTSPHLLSSKLSEIRESDTSSQEAAVPENLIKGLSSPYEMIYQPQNFRLQFELFEFPKDSIQWPWGDPVPFWKGTPVHKLSWGGFEVDVVGVRPGISKTAYIIRVRRPSRLDEYVLRKESQFKKYCVRLSKCFPNAHIRSIPSHEVGSENGVTSLEGLLREDGDQLIPDPKLDDVEIEAAFRQAFPTKIDQSLVDFQSRSHANPLFLDPFSSKPLNEVAVPVGEVPRRRATLASLFGIGNHKSKFSVDTRSDWNDFPGFARTKPKHELVEHDREIVGSSKAPHRRRSLGRSKDSSDAQRRALRDWLRDALSIRTVGHDPKTAAFLLLGSIVPEETDLLDIRHRGNIDEQRRRKRIEVAQGAAERAKAVHECWCEVKNEFVSGKGVHNLSKALRECSTIEGLPIRFQRALEWLRMNLSEALNELLVTGNQSDVLFRKLLAFHAALPWSLLKNVLKTKKPNLICKALLEVFLSKRLNLGRSKHSLIHRLIGIALDEVEDSPAAAERRIQACRARIQSLTMCEKIIKFVHAAKHLKDLFRHYSESSDVELVVAIVRSAEEPRLDKYDLERIVRASKVYKALLRKNRNRITRSMTENIHVRLILDLKLYLRLISQEWDSKQIRKMLSEESTTEAIKILVTPILEFIKRTYQVGNTVKALDDLQSFVEHLITAIHALRSRVQDPQKSIRVLSRLIAGHQHKFYEWLHMFHIQDPLIEECLEWLATIMNVLKGGLGQPLMISDIIDPENVENIDEELNQVVEWEQKKRKLRYEQLCRLYSADVDGDDPVIVEGDGFGKSKVEPLIDFKPSPPQLDHITSCLEFFRHAIRRTFLP